MKNSQRIRSMFVLFALAAIGLSAQTQRRPNRVTDRQVGGILQQLEQSSNRFRGTLNTALIQAHIDETRPQNDINSFEPAFVSAIDQFRDRFTQHIAVAADVENILQRAQLVNGFMTRNRLNAQVQNDWTSVRADLNSLSNAYSIAWQWNRKTPPVVNSSRPMVTGRLSDNELNQLIQRIETGGETFRSSLTDAFSRGRYDQTTSEGNMNIAVEDFKNATDQLRNRFDVRQPVTEYVERVLTRATPIDTYMHDNRLTTRTQSDWSTLRGDLNRLATAYHLSANWQNGVDPVPGNTGATSGEFIVGEGETVVAVLNNDLTTKQAKQGDRFSITARESRYQGAVIEGTIGSVTPGGRLTGRSGMSLNFDTIRLRNGQTYRFAGTLAGVRTLNGDTVKVDNEGSAQGDNQTTQTVTRAGIGTAVGAIVGAVVGGGKGAAIGAVIGTAGGAGSVYVTGKENLELPAGTELTIRASAPGR
jgi:hypothetical protein